MDKETLQTLLHAHRPDNAEDRRDPVFADALRETARDPELAAWFAESQKFDALMSKTLQGVPTPAALKNLILLNAEAGSNGRPKPASSSSTGAAGKILPFPHEGRRPLLAFAAAAALVLAATLLWLWLPKRGTADYPPHALALRAISQTAEMPALQFVCYDAAMVAQWVNEHSAAHKMGQPLRKPMASMSMIGSSAMQWDGKPVIMIALQRGERMGMLYLVRAEDFPAAGIGEGGEFFEKDGWVTKTARSESTVYVLATKGTRQQMDFTMPF